MLEIILALIAILCFATVDVSPLMEVVYAFIPVIFIVAIFKFIPAMLNRWKR